MSTEALNRIIKEVHALTPQERHELIDRLTHDEQNSPEQIVRKPGTPEERITAKGTTLHAWLNEARNLRAELPLTSDSVDILKELREVRSRQ